MSEERVEGPRPMTLNIQKVPEFSPNPEVNEALSWYRERESLLPEMKTRPASLEKGRWRVVKDAWGKVEKIESDHFDYVGLDVETPDLSWNQGMSEQRTVPADDQDGSRVRFAGAVVALVDSRGRVYFLVGNEPDAEKSTNAEGKEIHPTLKVLQGGEKKLSDLEGEGGGKFDQDLLRVQKLLGKSIRQIVQEVETNTHREGTMSRTAANIGILEVNDELVVKLEEIGGKFLDLEAVKALLPKLNRHAAEAHHRAMLFGPNASLS